MPTRTKLSQKVAATDYDMAGPEKAFRPKPCAHTDIAGKIVKIPRKSAFADRLES